MSYELIISEKPSSAKKMAEALADGKAVQKREGQVSYWELSHNKKDLVIASAVGHVYALQQKGDDGWVYPIFDVEWLPANKVSKKSSHVSKYLTVIRKLAKNANEFTVATDYDIEGEVIGLNVIKYACKQKDANRMFYSTTTKADLIKAYEGKRNTLDWPQANAGLARHELDYYYGINLSRALSLSIRHATGRFKVMSSGRVQGPALKIVVDKEKTIKAFIPEPYYQIQYDGKLGEVSLSFMHKKDRFLEEDKAKESFEKANKKDGVISKIDKRSQKNKSPNPFDLTTLQTEAYKTCGIQPKRTLEIAQELYSSSYISYPRTSSNILPEEIGYKKILEAISRYSDTIKGLVKEVFKFKELKPNNGKKKDPAHPAIYPTGMMPEKLEDQEKKIYDLILHRFIATFCPDATRETVKLIVDVNGEEFMAKGTRTTEPGWQAFYGPFLKLEEEELPACEEGDSVKYIKCEKLDKMTTPPKRYTPSSIIKELEKQGLGTKATRATIVDNLVQRGYMSGKSLAATELGIQTCDVLEKYSPKILDSEMTRSMEEEMDEIREGKKKPEDVLGHARDDLKIILDDFKTKEKEVGTELSQANQMSEDKKNTVGKCTKCEGGVLMVKRGKYGQFVGCTNYPDCKCTYKLPPNTKFSTTDKVDENGIPMISLARGKGKAPLLVSLAQGQSTPGAKPEPEEDAPECPKCSKKMIRRKSFYGEFYGCSGYPKCKGLVQIPKKEEEETKFDE